MTATKFSFYLRFFLTTLSIAAVFYLFVKHLAPTDSSISNWMINYQGGFTRRGILGELVFQLGIFLDLHIRFLIFIIQSSFYIFFYYLIYKYYKNVKLDFIVSLALFSPLFLIYPLAELESLGRLEIILLVVFLNYSLLAKKNFKIYFLFFYFIIPLLLLIWEAAIFYIPFFLLIYILNLGKINLFEIFKKTFIIVLPTLVTLFTIFLFKQSPIENKIMCEALIETYNQKCYMGLKATPQSTKVGILEVYHLFGKDGLQTGLINLARFILVLIIGNTPLMIVSYFCKFNQKKVSTFFVKYFSVLYLLFILNLLSFIIFYLAIDWGRWIHILYGMSLIFIIHLIKNKIIIYESELLYKKFIFIKKINKNILVIFFIFFCFTWNHKTVMHEDIGAVSGYKIIQKIYKWKDIIFYNSFDFSRNSRNYW